ncbi:ComEC/Rec2 family competence protein [Maritalea porphyrae]|uniref:ComEC/Rec2 family competence protein n=2 Tax=Maritalea TaxID=623276 RepID=UPI0022AE9AA6|nr:ComEC/Rec2 family competence protein [Maritalea porphyrae]MCZ4273044.1 ComEC/Rec2 family competence protein [Maritalea porphyrae]
MAAFDSETILKKNTQPPSFKGDPIVVRNNNGPSSRGVQRFRVDYKSAIADAFYHRQFVVLIPFALITGISLYRHIWVEPNLLAVGAVLFVLGTFFCWQRFRQNQARMLALVLAVWFGFSLITFAASWAGTKLLSYPIAVQNLSGEVIERSVGGEGQLRLLIGDLAGDDKLDGVRRLRLTIRAKHLNLDQPIALGDHITVRARIIPLPKPVYPASYDSQFQGFFDGIGGYASSLEPVQKLTPGNGSVWRAIDRLRWGIGERLDIYLSADQAAIARALIIGDQSGINDVLRENIANAGLAHVLAISGLHLTLVVGSVFFMIRIIVAQAVGQDRWIKPLAALGAIGVAIGYLMISGANLATQRATLMLVLAFVAILVGRRAITMRNVAIAAIVIIVLFPHEIFKPGFQLSFAAVVGLVAVYAIVGRSALQVPFLAKLFGGLALTSLIAGVATAPIAAVHFQQFAPMGLIGNLIAVPIVGFFVLPSGLAAVLLMPLGLEGPFLAGMGMGIDLVVAVARTISAMSANYTQTPMLAEWVLPGCFVALCWLSFFRGWLKFFVPGVFGLAIVGFGAAALPFMVVSDSTQAVIVRQADEFFQMGRKSNSFTSRAWAERFGSSLIDHEAVGACDKHGCSAEVGGRVISVVKDSVGLNEDCGRADVLIVRQRREVSCLTALVIEQKQLDRQGVATIFLDEQGQFEVRWAINDQRRPWRP